MLIVKIKVQDSSSKASISRVCDREDQSRGLVEGAQGRKQGTAHAVCSEGHEDLGVQGADEVVGKVVGGGSWTSPGPCL